MEAQQFAFNVGASRRSLEDEMRRRSLGRQLERIHAENPGALEGMLSGSGPAPPPVRTPSVMRGGGYGGGSSSGPNPGAALQAKWDRQADAIDYAPETYEGGGGGGGVLGTSDPRAPGYHRSAVDVALAERRISEADENNAAMRAITAREMQDAYGGSGAYGRGSTAPGQKPGLAFEQALALKMAGKAGARAPAGTAASGAPKETAKAQMEFLAAQQLYQQAAAAEEEAKASLGPAKTNWFGRAIPQNMSGVETAAAATAKAKETLAKAEAKYTAAKTVHGEGAPEAAAAPAMPAATGFSGTLPGGTGFGTNQPESNIMPGLTAKYGKAPDPRFAKLTMDAPAAPSGVTADNVDKFAERMAIIRGEAAPATAAPLSLAAGHSAAPEMNLAGRIAGKVVEAPKNAVDAIEAARKASTKKYAEGVKAADKNAASKNKKTASSKS